MRVLLVDDNADVRHLLRRLLERDGLEVVGEARDGYDALRLFRLLAPDVVVLDHEMPRMTGLDVARLLREERPTQNILVCSAYLHTELLDLFDALGVLTLDKAQMRRIPGVIRCLAGGAPDA